MTTDVEIEQRLREAFAYRADRIVVSEDGPSFRASRTVDRRAGRPWIPLAGVAAASIVLVGGLLVVRNATTEEPSSSDTVPPESVDIPARPVAAIDDPTAIDLDAWQPLPEAGDTGVRFFVLDIDRLPDGYVSAHQEASTFLGGKPDQPFYVSTNRLDAATGADVFVSVESYQFAPCALLDDPANDESTQEPVAAIDGVEASMVGDTLCWKLEPGVYASVRFAGEFAADDDVDRLVRVADELRFEEQDRLPAETDTERAPDPIDRPPDDPAFAGLIGGVRWSATVSDTTLRSMQVYVAGRGSSGFEHDRLSQPNDIAAATGDVSITGASGAGALVFGYVMPEAASVVVRSSGEAMRLPLVRRELESYFAFPVPEGVVIDVVEFADADGDPIARLELPYLPPRLSGSYGGTVEVERI